MPERHLESVFLRQFYQSMGIRSECATNSNKLCSIESAFT